MILRVLLLAFISIGLASLILKLADLLSSRFEVIDDALDGFGGWLAIALKIAGKIALNISSRPQL